MKDIPSAAHAPNVQLRIERDGQPTVETQWRAVSFDSGRTFRRKAILDRINRAGEIRLSFDELSAVLQLIQRSVHMAGEHDRRARALERQFERPVCFRGGLNPCHVLQAPDHRHALQALRGFALLVHPDTTRDPRIQQDTRLFQLVVAMRDCLLHAAKANHSPKRLSQITESPKVRVTVQLEHETLEVGWDLPKVARACAPACLETLLARARSQREVVMKCGELEALLEIARHIVAHTHERELRVRWLERGRHQWPAHHVVPGLQVCQALGVPTPKEAAQLLRTLMRWTHPDSTQDPRMRRNPSLFRMLRRLHGELSSAAFERSLDTLSKN